MVSAIVLLTVARNKINAVAERLADMDGISEVFSVAGEYDLAAIIRVKDNDGLAELVTNQHAQGGRNYEVRNADRVPRLFEARSRGDVLDRGKIVQCPRSKTSRHCSYWSAYCPCSHRQH